MRQVTIMRLSRFWSTINRPWVFVDALLLLLFLLGDREARALPPPPRTYRYWPTQSSHPISSGRFLVDNDGTNTLEESSNGTLSPSNGTQQQNATLGKNGSPNDKSLKICTVLGGLDITRLLSTFERIFWADIVQDAELMREHLVEIMIAGGVQNGFSNLTLLDQSLDLRRPDLPENATTTSEAGLGTSDDRPTRRRELWVAANNWPFVGDKQTDADMADAGSTLLPWIVDRKARPDAWAVDHPNGNSTLTPSHEPLVFDSLYTGAYYETWGGVISYYPPIYPVNETEKIGNFGNSFGDTATSNNETIYEHQWLYPALWEANPSREAVFFDPFLDWVIPGLALMTVAAPVYYTGEWRGYVYNDTYIACACLDISLISMAERFDSAEDTLVDGSFALLVDVGTFQPVVISQHVVSKIYPERTGFEESRVVRLQADGSIQDDRRNQTYLVGDTIHQGITNLTNADWSGLQIAVNDTDRGERNSTVLNVTLTGDKTPTEFYVMFDRWLYVSDWAVLVFAPVQNVDNAIRVEFTETQLFLLTEQRQHAEVVGNSQTILRNLGTLDVTVSAALDELPSWMSLKTSLLKDGHHVLLRAGEELPVDFTVDPSQLNSVTTTSSVSLRVRDADYPDCFYDQDSTFAVSVTAYPEENRNYIGRELRIIGFTLALIVLATSAGFALWIVVFRNLRVVRASQPVFLGLVCIGTFVMGSAIIPLSIDDEVASTRGCDVACMAAPWLIAMGFTITFSSLFSKIWRINKLILARQFRRVKVTATDVLVPFVVLFVLNFAFLLGWTLVDPLRWQRMAVGDPANMQTVGLCVPSGTTWIVFLTLIIAVNLTALVLAAVQAYRARNISDEYSESRYIAIAILGMLEVLVVGIPVMVLVGTNPAANFFLRAVLVFVVCMVLLLLVFVPKIIHAKTFLKRERVVRQARLTVSGLPSVESVSGTGAVTSRVVHSDAAESSICEGVPVSGGSESTSSNEGLRLRVYCLENHSSNEADLRHQNEEYRRRVEALESYLKERGHDVDALFEKDGLSTLDTTSNDATIVVGNGIDGNGRNESSLSSSKSVNIVKFQEGTAQVGDREDAARGEDSYDTAQGEDSFDTAQGEEREECSTP